MVGTSASLNTRTNLNSEFPVPTLSSRFVALARAVIFLAVIVAEQTELVAENECSLPLLLLSAIVVVYVLVTSTLSVLGYEYQRLRLVFVTVDVISISALIYVAGNLENTYYLLYYVPIMQAGIRLNFRDAIAAGMLAAAMYNLVTVARGPNELLITPAQFHSLTFGGSVLAIGVCFALVGREVRTRANESERVKYLARQIRDRADELVANTPGNIPPDMLGLTGSLEAPFPATGTAPRAVLRIIGDLLGAKYRWLRVHPDCDGQGGWITSYPKGQPASPRLRKLAEELADLSSRREEAIVLQHVAQDPALQQFADEVRSVLVIPLVMGTRTLATVVLCDKEPSEVSRSETFDEADLAVASAFAAQAALLLDYARLHRDMRSLLRGAVGALASAVDAKDPDTHGHSARVAFYAVFLARALNLPTRAIAAIELGALLHDVGKIGMDDLLLSTKYELEQHDWETIKKHPETGAHIFGQLAEFSFILPALRHHHERYTGRLPRRTSGLRYPADRSHHRYCRCV